MNVHCTGVWARKPWARNTVVNAGLLKKDSPRGIREISDKGKGYPRQNA